MKQDNIAQFESPDRLIFSDADKAELAGMLRDLADEVESKESPTLAVIFATLNSDREIHSSWFRGPNSSRAEVIGMAAILKNMLMND